MEAYQDQDRLFVLRRSTTWIERLRGKARDCRQRGSHEHKFLDWVFYRARDLDFEEDSPAAPPTFASRAAASPAAASPAPRAASGAAPVAPAGLTIDTSPGRVGTGEATRSIGASASSSMDPGDTRDGFAVGQSSSLSASSPSLEGTAHTRGDGTMNQSSADENINMPTKGGTVEGAGRSSHGSHEGHLPVSLDARLDGRLHCVDVSLETIFHHF
eukprot:g13182.t1